jgi:hypothetical protein
MNTSGTANRTVAIEVPREAVESKAVRQAADSLRGFVPDLLEQNRNRVEIVIRGYDDDLRELYDISAVRLYFQLLFEEVPELFYWIDVNSPMFLFLGAMLYTPLKEPDGSFGLSQYDMQAYLVRGFSGLIRFCREQGISPEPTNNLVNAWLGAH